MAGAVKLSDLNERQQFALRLLARETDCAVSPRDSATGWDVPTRTMLALELPEALIKAGLWELDHHKRDPWNVSGHANTLVALKRRGLATSDSGGVFVQCRWWITPAGAQLLGDAEQDRNPDPVGGTE